MFEILIFFATFTAFQRDFEFPGMIILCTLFQMKEFVCELKSSYFVIGTNLGKLEP